jgi:hypothetical protein
MEPNRHHRAQAAERTAARKMAAAPGKSAAAVAKRDRRMDLRAYNHWASMLNRRRFPTVAELASGTLCDIAAHSVLLDVSVDADNPAIAYLGERLAGECNTTGGALQRLADAPQGSLLARVAGHYRTVLANGAPTAFEAEFAGLRGASLLYRGILLPFSSDDATIDFVLAVINWKELPAAEMRQLAEVDERSPAGRRTPSPAVLLTDWADGPGSDLGGEPDPLPAVSVPAGASPAAGVPEQAPSDASPLPGEAAHQALPAALTERLRRLPPQPISALSPAGTEFALVMIRRAAGSPAALLGEVACDLRLMEQAAQRLAR